MFSYQLPNGGLRTNSFINAEGNIKFDPPVFEQRYSTAIRILEDPRWNNHIKKIVEFGCAEMRLIPLLRRIDNIELILAVDIDGSLLKSRQQVAQPLVVDYVIRRANPLRIEVLQGSIDASVEKVRNMDAVIGLEIIEHLYPEVLDKVPKNVFGFIQPKLAIFSTPNSEFNVLFQPLLSNGFRHLDHKFEWNRAEFKKWAQNICKEYPNYKVAYIGAGKPPPDQKHIGYVSQIAIFARKDMLGEPLVAPINEDVPANTDPDVQYKTVHEVDFPFDHDERTKEEKIFDEAQFHINQARSVERYFNRERRIYQLPLTKLIAYAATVDGTEEELRSILQKNNIEVEGDFIVLSEYDEDEDNYRQYDDCYDDCNADEYGADAEYDEELSSGTASAPKEVDYETEENWD